MCFPRILVPLDAQYLCFLPAEWGLKPQAMNALFLPLSIFGNQGLPFELRALT